MTARTFQQRETYWGWVRASSWGWLAGLLAVIGLAILADLLVPTESGGQAIVGIGIGGGVGLMQARYLSDRLKESAQWALASVVGMGTLFVVHDLVRVAGGAFPFSLPLYVLVGALLTGIWQRFLLRPLSENANWWVAASLVGWALPAGAIALADSEAAGTLGAILGLGTIFFGGVLLGLVSGGPLAWLLGESTGSADHGGERREHVR